MLLNLCMFQDFSYSILAQGHTKDTIVSPFPVLLCYRSPRSITGFRRGGWGGGGGRGIRLNILVVHYLKLSLQWTFHNFIRLFTCLTRDELCPLLIKRMKSVRWIEKNNTLILFYKNLNRYLELYEFYSSVEALKE